MVINKSVYKEIYRTIMSKEMPNETKKEELISARELLKVLKERYSKKEEFCKNYLKELNNFMPNIKRIELLPYHTRLNDYLTMVIYFDNDPKLVRTTILQYDHGKIREIGLKPCLIPAKEDDLLKELALYGIENHFNENLNINTVSNVFSLTSFHDDLAVTLGSKAIKGYFYFAYDFLEEQDKKAILTPEGKIIIETNIWKVKKLFSKPAEDLVRNYYRDEKNPALRFLNHLQVYESDVPEYLLDDIKRERTLK